LTVTPLTSTGNPASSAAMPGDVAIVFAGLVGAAENDVVDAAPIDRGVALDERLYRDRCEIVVLTPDRTPP